MSVDIITFLGIDWSSFFIKYLSKKALDKAHKEVEYFLLSNDNQFEIKYSKLDYDEVIRNMQEHLSSTARWASAISFRDMRDSRNLMELFIDLDFYVTPIKYQFPNENSEILPLKDVLNFKNNNLVLLGKPGAGKTTTIKKIFIEFLLNRNDNYKDFNNIILIRLLKFQNYEFSEKNIIKKELLGIFGVQINYTDVLYEQEKINATNDIFYRFMNQFPSIILLDGFDEINNFSIRGKIISDLEDLSIYCKNCRFILTSRTSDFDCNIFNTNVYEIKDLDKKQIRIYCEKWFKSKSIGKKVFKVLMDSPFSDTTINPLLLAHICALYSRDKTIPETPYAIYDKIVQLLLEEWSIQNRVKRVSKYANFYTNKKQKFISHLAYELSVNENTSRMDYRLLEKVYIRICSKYQLPVEEARQVVEEVESHHGLIIKTSRQYFEFAHKSIHEYLTANYLNILPTDISLKKDFKRIPNEVAIWIALSGDSNYLFFKLSPKIAELDINFITPFFNRLLLENPNFSNSFLIAYTILSIMSNRLFRLVDNEKLIIEKIESNNELIENLKKKNQDSIDKKIKNLTEEQDKIRRNFSNVEMLKRIIEKNKTIEEIQDKGLNTHERLKYNSNLNSIGELSIENKELLDICNLIEKVMAKKKVLSDNLLKLPNYYRKVKTIKFGKSQEIYHYKNTNKIINEYPFDIDLSSDLLISKNLDLFILSR